MSSEPPRRPIRTKRGRIIGTYVRYGAAKSPDALLMVGGFTERIASLALPAEALSKLMPVYVIETASYHVWRSPLARQQRTLREAMRLVSTHHKKVHIISHSAGAIAAVRLVAHSYEQDQPAIGLASLLLVAPAGIGRTTPRRLIKRAWKEVIAQQLPRLLQHARRTVPVSLGYAVMHPIASLHELYGIAVADIRDAINLLVARRIPVTIISGRRDNLFSTRHIKEAFKGRHPKPDFVETPDSHNDILIDPDGAHEVVKKILARQK